MTDETGAAKLDVIAPVMSKLGYAAVGIGPADARLGEEFFKRAAAARLNVIDASSPPRKKMPAYVIKNVGGVRVGVVSFGCLPPKAVVNDASLRKARYAALKQARAKSDVLILLDQAGVATSEWVQNEASKVGVPDIVVGGSTTSKVTQENVVGTTHLLPTLQLARQLGVVDLEIAPGQSPTMSFRRVLLNDKYPEDPAIAKQVTAAQEKLAAATLAATPRPPRAPGTTRAYYSSQGCRNCHQKEYENWAKTKHAHALETLAPGKNTTPDCLRCHSEVFRVIQRYVPQHGPEAGVECQTCHYYSLPHGMERKNSESKAKVDPKICLDCHTKDRSPDYNPKTYFPKISHVSIAPLAKPR